MNPWLLRLAQALGLALLLVTLTSALLPTAPAEGEKTALALRQIGHDYLTQACDATSRIPAVIKRDNGSLLLKLERNIDYDTLVTITRAVLATYDIDRDYTLFLEDCATSEVFLGSFWESPFSLNSSPGEGGACMGRDQEFRCANISINFAKAEAAGTQYGNWLLGGLGLLLLFAGPLARQGEVPSDQVGAPAAANEEAPAQITARCSFDETTQLLRVGAEEHQLTYREGQLLAYLVARPNEILQRQAIHDAVWGVDGIITGRSLDVFVSRLRKKLAGDDGVEIKTVHGVGYQFLVTA